ncbi:MAG: UbiH/UbiF/VisC/COQ6 family ubiquinone biosynthesis hydroxylase [Aquisalimonadaceae bacterium]
MADRLLDVVINGGGVVGLALAAALDGHGLKVAVVEAREPPAWNPEQTDLRVSSITGASRRLLMRLGVWDTLEHSRVSPFDAIHAWDAGGGLVRFNAADIGEPWLGHIVENGLLQRTLYDHVRSRCRQVTLFCPGSIQAVDLTPAEFVRLRLDDGRRLRSRLLVGADGADSAIREQAGISVRRRAYGQQGVVAAVRMEQQHGGVARQRFLPGGPLALLPLDDGRCSIVWSVPDAEAESLLGLEDAAFREALGEASEHVLGPVLEVGARRAFALQSLHADRYIAGRVALVGDAAHVIHPLAGQGVNLGLLDAAALAEVLIGAAARGRDLGSLPALRRYERWRRGDNLVMQQAMDGFNWLFSNSDPLRHTVRNIGFHLTDRLPSVKRRFMEYAVGVRGDLPGLAKP